MPTAQGDKVLLRNEFRGVRSEEQTHRLIPQSNRKVAEKWVGIPELSCTTHQLALIALIACSWVPKKLIRSTESPQGLHRRKTKSDGTKQLVISKDHERRDEENMTRVKELHAFIFRARRLNTGIRHTGHIQSQNLRGRTNR